MRLQTFVFAAAIAAGGVYAFMKKGSAQSLGVSLAASSVLALCASKMTGPGSPQTAVAVACGVCILLFFEMSGRYTQTQKMMPAGMVRRG